MHTSEQIYLALEGQGFIDVRLTAAAGGVGHCRAPTDWARISVRGPAGQPCCMQAGGAVGATPAQLGRAGRWALA